MRWFWFLTFIAGSAAFVVAERFVAFIGRTWIFFLGVAVGYLLNHP